MITINFAEGSRTARNYTDLWQYDYGQILHIDGLDLPPAAEIHFALNPTGGDSITRVGTTTDGVTTVRIPDDLLINSDTTQDYYIYAYIYLTDETSGQTEYKISLKVRSRPRPGTDIPDPENPDIFADAIQAVNDSADRAENARDTAEQIQQEVETTAKTTIAQMQDIQSSTQGYADQTHKDASTAQTAREGVEDILTHAQAVQESIDQTAVRVAEDSKAATDAATQTAQDALNTASDRVATQSDRQAAETAKTAAQEARAGAETALKQTQDTAAKAQADIAISKTAAVKEINSTGAGQVSSIQAAGTQAVQDVTQAAAEIVADREQIKANTAAIAQAAKDVSKFALTGAESGSYVTLQDSADWPLLGLDVHGKCEQDTTTGAQLLNTKINNHILGTGVNFTVNEDGSITADGTSENACSMFFGNYINQLEDGKEYYYKSDSKQGCLKIVYNDERGTSYATKITVDRARMTTIEPYIQCAPGESINRIIYPMFNAGSTALPWEPYTGGQASPNAEYPQEIREIGTYNPKTGKYEVTVRGSGKNLLDRAAMKIGRYLFGIATISNTVPIYPYTPTTEVNGVAGIVKCCKGVTYTFSVTNPNANAAVMIAEYKNAQEATDYKNKIGFANRIANNATYTAQGNGVLICLIASAYTDGNTKIHTCTESELLQVEIGDTATPYEPCQSQEITVELDQPLRGIDDARDVITEYSGQIGVLRKITKWKPESLTKTSEKENTSSYSAKGGNVKILRGGTSPRGLCNRLIWGYNQTDKPHFFWEDRRSNAWVYLPKDYEPDPADFEFCGVLETPVFEPFPQDVQAQYRALKSHPGVTHIWVDDPLAPEVSVKYVKDANLVMQRVWDSIAALQTAQAQTVAAFGYLPAETQAAMIENETNDILESEELL